ncbi:hypothetical protein GALL_236560 [mine drainage metagenome]|uniref:Uncharacterized protein n=1 Tax=mine drainage metagenome TaxID=410659 RepID=A0A1J5RF64_9ZZZZ
MDDDAQSSRLRTLPFDKLRANGLNRRFHSPSGQAGITGRLKETFASRPLLSCLLLNLISADS